MDQSFITNNPRGRKSFRRCTSRVAVCLTLVHFILLVMLPVPSHGQSAPPPKTADTFEPYLPDRSGPWGELEYIRIHIEPPNEFVHVENVQLDKARWYFSGFTPETLTTFLRGCDLSPSERDTLLDPKSWSVETNVIIIKPGDKIVLELTPKSRQKIYAELAKDDRNVFQANPFFYPSGTMEDWLGHSGLPGATMTWLERLVYQRGNSLCFSDLPELFALTPDINMRKRLLKTLSRNATILMKLKIKPDTDVNQVGAYWAKGKHAKDITPLLDSLMAIPGGMTIDVVQLLPPLARKLLNTYPSFVPGSNQQMPDCYWTAMNFFNDPPDDRYYDDAVWQQELNEHYTVVSKATFGDLFFLHRRDGLPMHAAVYIADDVVFTKNGGNYRQPWILMKIPDLFARYAEDSSIRLVCYHRKEPAN